MEYTTNYHLPQWVERDRIMMEDFNQMCAEIEAGLTETKNIADRADASAGEGAEKITGLETRVTAVETDVKFVKLAGPSTLATDWANLTISLTGINPGDYTAFVLIASGLTSGTVSLSVNGTSLLTLYSNSGSNGSTAVAWLLPYKNVVIGWSDYCSATTNSAGKASGFCSCSWNSITNLTLSGSIRSGTTCTLYGIKE